ncbi:MAG TPA: LacI family DNA-binding transcriptional regulator [Microlunatus sp.]|nr:LacI family DNA-binding transcriptional regulator [Microlunatus sp.]
MTGDEPTIYDIAREAGVAPSTVSRALSKPGRVSFRTAEHVREVAQRLGYRARQIDLGPVARRQGLIALFVADIANPVFVGLIRGAERAAAEHDTTLLLIESQESESAEQAAITRLVPLVDGIVLTSSRLTDHEIRATAKNVPLVLLNRDVRDVASVTCDNVHAIKKAVEHLVGLGHRRICYLAGPEASWADAMRWRGVREAGLELSLTVRRIGPQLPTLRGGRMAAEAWLERRSTAVIAYNDLMALGFCQHISQAGIRIPEQVSVIGFDNIIDTTLVQPPLTTIAAPQVSIGSAAIGYLLGRRRPADADHRESVRLPARLVVRGSTDLSPG